jgi:hypothetical protein
VQTLLLLTHAYIPLVQCATAMQVGCNDIAPPRYKVGGKWYCSYPELRERHDPAMLPVDEVKIDLVNVNNIRLG